MNRTMSTGENALAIAAQALGYSTLKDKQIEVVRNFLEGHDVFGVLPTGYGKSICFACLPLIFDHLSGLKESSIVIVVAPLVAIMKDQVCSTCSYHEGSGMFHLELFRSFLYHVILYVCRYNLGQREDSK